jgi:hypothetical protein
LFLQSNLDLSKLILFYILYWEIKIDIDLKGTLNSPEGGLLGMSGPFSFFWWDRLLQRYFKIMRGGSFSWQVLRKKELNCMGLAIRCCI